MERTGNGIVRHAFRTRKGIGEERLPVGECRECKGETYQTLTGLWLHWSTLTGACPVAVTPVVGADGLSSLSDGQEGAIS